MQRKKNINTRRKKRDMNDMLFNFSERNCPTCGDMGKELSKKIYTCGKCEVLFNEFYISIKKNKEPETRFWT